MGVAKDFFSSKTTWTGIAAIITAAATWYAGSITPAEAIAAIFVALQSLWIRDTAAKGHEKVAEEVKELRQSVAGVPPSERVVTGDS